MADVEGSTRIEGVAASIHEGYMDGHGNKVAEDAVFKIPCVVIIFDEVPRYREVQSKPESKHPRMAVYRDRASGPAETRAETRPRTRSAVARQGQRNKTLFSCLCATGTLDGSLFMYIYMFFFLEFGIEPPKNYLVI